MGVLSCTFWMHEYSARLAVLNAILMRMTCVKADLGDHQNNSYHQRVQGCQSQSHHQGNARHRLYTAVATGVAGLLRE